MEPPPNPVDPLDLLDAAPSGEYSLLELGVEWDELAEIQAQLAAALRPFVITRDPLAWLPDRGSAWATGNADGDILEVPLYVTLDEVRRRVSAGGGDLATAIGPLCETAVLGADRCQGVVLSGAYPELAFRGEVPALLSLDGDGATLGRPAVTVRDKGWEPIGLGAIQDLVQEAFGPVDFDRSTVVLRAADARRSGCPACAGIRFGFPGELSEALPTMCDHHRIAADEITSSRIAHARASNPAGWRAIGKASARINGLPEPAGMPMPQRRHAQPRRNDPCPCGSGRKYKHCCGT